MPTPPKSTTVVSALPDAVCLPPSLADDLLRGAEDIAEFLFGSKGERRRVYWLIERGQLPVFKLGETWFARKSSLISAIEAREQAIFKDTAS
jgi:hypothetical protein